MKVPRHIGQLAIVSDSNSVEHSLKSSDREHDHQQMRGGIQLGSTTPRNDLRGNKLRAWLQVLQFWVCLVACVEVEWVRCEQRKMFVAKIKSADRIFAPAARSCRNNLDQREGRAIGDSEWTPIDRTSFEG